MKHSSYETFFFVILKYIRIIHLRCFWYWQSHQHLPTFPISAPTRIYVTIQLCKHFQFISTFYPTMMLGFFAFAYAILWLECPSLPIVCLESYSALTGQTVQEFLIDWQPQKKEPFSLMLNRPYSKMSQNTAKEERRLWMDLEQNYLPLCNSQHSSTHCWEIVQYFKMWTPPFTM